MTEEAVKWFFEESCTLCNTGLINRMDQLMEKGHPQREAAKIMAEESEPEGVWSAAAIRSRYNYYKTPGSPMDGNQPPVPTDLKKKTKKEKEEPNAPTGSTPATAGSQENEPDTLADFDDKTIVKAFKKMLKGLEVKELYVIYDLFDKAYNAALTAAQKKEGL